MSYTIDLALAIRPDFIGQVQMAIIKFASGLVSDPTLIKVIVDQKRVALARAVINDSVGYAPRFAFLIVESGLNSEKFIDGLPVDTDIDTLVAKVWSGLAGVMNSDF